MPQTVPQPLQLLKKSVVGRRLLPLRRRVREKGKQVKDPGRPLCSAQVEHFSTGSKERYLCPDKFVCIGAVVLSEKWVSPNLTKAEREEIIKALTLVTGLFLFFRNNHLIENDPNNPHCKVQLAIQEVTPPSSCHLLHYAALGKTELSLLCL